MFRPVIVILLVLGSLVLVPAHASIYAPQLVASGATGTSSSLLFELANGPAFSHCGGSNGCAFASVFTMATTSDIMILDHFVVELVILNGPGPSGTLVPALFPTVNSLPSGTTPLTTGKAVPITTVNSASATAYTFSFSHNFILVSGTKYAIGLESMNTTDWGGTTGIETAGTASGNNQEGFYTNAWSIIGNFQANFQVFAVIQNSIADAAVVMASLFGLIAIVAVLTPLITGFQSSSRHGFAGTVQTYKTNIRLIVLFLVIIAIATTFAAYYALGG